MYYEVYDEEPKILGSGSQISSVAHTHDETEVFELLANGRNTLTRCVRIHGKSRFQTYDRIREQWIDH